MPSTGRWGRRQVVLRRDGYTGGYWGGVIPGTQPACSRRVPCTAKRAPEALAEGWSGWYMGAGRPGDAYPHPAGPVGPPRWPSLGYARGAASGPIRRDLTSFTVKLVKTAKCRSNMSIRPVIVPVSKNGSKKSALKILRFPFSAAFSHKELIGSFWPGSRVHCQNDEVSPDVHTDVREGVTQIPPRSREQARPCDRSSSGFSAGDS